MQSHHFKVYRPETPMELQFTVVSIGNNWKEYAAVESSKKYSTSDDCSFSTSALFLAHADTWEKGRSLLLEHTPHLLLLDIDLFYESDREPMIEKLASLATWPLQIVLCSSSSQYAITALRHSVFDYLLSPFSCEDFQKMLNRFAVEFQSKEQIAHSSENEQKQEHAVTYVVNTALGFRKIVLSDIVYFEHIKSSKYWRVYLTDMSSLTLRKDTSANDILKLCDTFVQVNQMYVINLRYLAFMRRHDCTLMSPYEGVTISVSRVFAQSLLDRLTVI